MKSSSFNVISWLGALFYAVVVFSIFFLKPPAIPPVSKVILNELLSGNSPFNPVGFQFSAFKPLLPPHEKVSFIMDFPFSPYVKNIDQLYAAQSYLTPIVLSPFPDQRAAIIYCSTTAVAEARMKETGYRILLPIAEGKGIAVKR
jgi:hypothetical protein